MENLVLDRPITGDAQTKGQTMSQELWEIVTGLTRLYFSNPNLQARERRYRGKRLPAPGENQPETAASIGIKIPVPGSLHRFS